MDFKFQQTIASRQATSEKESSAVSMPYLPDDLLLNCLARISRLYYPTLSLVSKRFCSLLASTELYETRRLLGSTESCPYFCIKSPGISKPHWFTLSRVPTRIPNPNSRWFTSCFGPCKSRTTRNLMVSVPSHSFSYPSRWTFTTIGFNIYMIGGYINREPSSRVFVMDCRSHTWHEAPSMRVPRYRPLVSAVDGKIYVVEGCDCDPSDFMEFFDPQTQMWEHVPSPGAEIRGAYMVSSFAKEGNLYLAGEKSVIYKPKEQKWVVVKQGRHFGATSDSSCDIDNVEYCYTDGSGSGSSRRLEWYCRKRSSWIALKDLGQLPKLPKGNDCVRLETYGKNIAVFWEENVRAGCTKKKKIWCAEIAIERPNKEEVCGKVEWCDVVLTVPKSCSFEQFIVATV
ncbi:Kelch repeat type 1 [Arabidopsis suecica]|uniref:Kelch repeat type 1 n=1 Tax=Arabidopsis suecica TaxID=45249 RepID=A0A8T1YKV9_ARASU|nr:Kelch repeat type 1 [Arabidopsis suecica]